MIHLKMFSAALDEEGDDIVLRGTIDPDTLDAVKADTYQREIGPAHKIESISKALAKRAVPDILLGMRGGNYDEKSGAFICTDPVFVIDGFQRLTAARLVVSRGARPILGAKLLFNTSREFEKEMFETLSQTATRISPNILLRNKRDKLLVIALVHDVTTNEEGFPLRGRVCWSQSMKRDHLLTATTICKTMGSLHAHFGSGNYASIDPLALSMQAVMDKIGKANYRTNMLAFFGIMEECWGISRVVYKAPCAALRGTFMRALARVLGEHEQFWNEKRLVLTAPQRKKLASFPIADPSVADICGGGGAAGGILFDLLVRHFDSSKRGGSANKLTAWPEPSRGGKS